MSDFGERIKLAAEKVGGLNQLAKLVGMPRRTLGDVVSGKTEAKISLVNDVARVTGAKVHWLVTGKGRSGLEKIMVDESERYLVDPSDGMADPDVMIGIAEAVRLAHESAKVSLPSHRFMQLVVDAYNSFIADDIDLSDEDEIGARITLLRKKILRDLEYARLHPGTGKQSA